MDDYDLTSIPRDILERFSSAAIPRPSLDACWPWPGRTTKGYGVAGHRAGSTHYAHRVAYVAAHGAIPAGLSVCHSCDVPSCVNPAHLFLGTPAENSADMVAKRRQMHGSSHRNARLSESDVIAIRSARLSGAMWRMLAAQYGVTMRTIRDAFAGRTWASVPLVDGDAPRNSPHGSGHGHAKLTEADIPAIRIAISMGEPKTAIGHRFGVSGEAICAIAAGRTWRHVP